MKIIFCFLFLVASRLTFANIDPESGNLFVEFVDHDPASMEGTPLLRRYYNSLSDYRGLFARAWASDLDSRLDFLPDGNVAVLPYGAGRVRIFETTPFKLDPAWKLPEQINVKEKLISDLKNDKVFRYQWLKNNGHLSSTFSSKSFDLFSGGESLSLKNNQWTFRDSAGESWFFDASGKLVGFILEKGGKWTIKYRNNRIESLTDGKNLFPVFYNSDGFIERIEIKKSKLTYIYQNGLMSESHDGTGKKFNYAYSAAGQLEGIRANDFNSSYVYTPNTGKVTRVVENNENTEIRYDLKKAGNAEILLTTIQSKEGQEKLEYTYITDSQGRYLSKLREITPAGTAETHFNSSRLPIRLIENGVTQEILYDSQGRIAEIKKSGVTHTKVTRDQKSGKVNQISDGLSLRKFVYTPNGKIQQVTLGDGTRLKFDYGPSGYIQSAELIGKGEVSEGRLTPVYDGSVIKDILLDGKKPQNSVDKLRALRFQQAIQEALAMPRPI